MCRSCFVRGLFLLCRHVLRAQLGVVKISICEQGLHLVLAESSNCLGMVSRDSGGLFVSPESRKGNGYAGSIIL